MEESRWLNRLSNVCIFSVLYGMYMYNVRVCVCTFKCIEHGG